MGGDGTAANPWFYVVTNKNPTQSFNVGAASYYVYGVDYDGNNNPVPRLGDQKVAGSDLKVVGPNGEVTLFAVAPACAYQVDVFCGPLITDFSQGLYNDRKIPNETGSFNGAFWGPSNWTTNLCPQTPQ